MTDSGSMRSCVEKVAGGIVPRRCRSIDFRMVPL